MLHKNNLPLLLTAAVAVTSVRLGLWLLPFGTLGRITTTLSRPKRPATGFDPTDICRAIMIVSRCVPRATCLTQAIAAQMLLGRGGQATHLRIGVGKPTGGLRAHAWLENEQGEILIGHTDRSQFVLLPSIDRAAAA